MLGKKNSKNWRRRLLGAEAEEKIKKDLVDQGKLCTINLLFEYSQTKFFLTFLCLMWNVKWPLSSHSWILRRDCDATSKYSGDAELEPSCITAAITPDPFGALHSLQLIHFS
jgi:hypothetical protein